MMKNRFWNIVLPSRIIINRTARPVFLACISVTILTCSCTDKIIFHPPLPSYQDGPDIVKIDIGDSEQISAIYLENPRAEFTVLFSHGNAEDIGQNLGFFEMLRQRGFSVLAYDYRGYGTSTGKASVQNAYLDIEAAYKYLTLEKKTEPGKIIALGRSVGGGPAVYLATKEDIGGLIFESVFVSAFRVATRTPMFPFDDFNNIDRIEKVRCPVLIVHGTKDNTISIWHGKELFKKANPPKLSLWVEDAGHHDLLGRAGERYWQTMEQFVTLIKGQGSQ